MSQSIRVLVVHRSRLMRGALAALLGDCEGVEAIPVVPGALDAPTSPPAPEAAVALVEAGSAEANAPARIAHLRRLLPHTRVVAFGVSGDESRALACIEAGASACLAKDADRRALLEAVRVVERGGSVCPPQLATPVFERLAQLSHAAQRSAGPAAAAALTQRQEDVVRALARGLSNKEIAQELRLETYTVRNHVHNILTRLRLTSRIELIRYACESGLVSGDGA